MGGDLRASCGAKKKFGRGGGRGVKGEIRDPFERKEPGKKEVPSSPAGKPEKSWNRYPAGEGPGEWAHVGLLDAENACRIHAPAKESGIAANVSFFVRGINGEEGLFRFCLAAPVKVRVGIEDLQPAHEENQERYRISPVGEACDPVVAIG